MITAGIDCGAKNTKTIIMKDGKIIGKGMVSTGFDQKKAVEDSLAQALNAAAISGKDIERFAATGSGKDAIEMADKHVNDIKAIGRAARYFFPKARTVADIGAEEGRVVVGANPVVVSGDEELLLNRGGDGFYRVNYPAETLQQLAAGFGGLEPAERYTLLPDTWAGVLAGARPATSFPG